MTHPREALTESDIETVVHATRSGRNLADTHRFSFIALHDSGKGPDAPRQAVASIIDRASGVVSEAVVSLPSGDLVSFIDIAGAVPPLLYEEAMLASITTYEDDRWREAMRKRGITDFDSVQLDPWPPGWFGEPEDDRRLARVLSYRRDFREDNGYARPIEGVVVWVDLEKDEIVRFEDHGVVTMPPNQANYRAEDVELRTDRAALEISQPDGPGFSVEGNVLTWQRWDMRITMHAITGLTLHDVGYQDPAAGRRRSIAHQLGLSEMVVPYGDVAAAHNWKNAFDCGEWGLGRMANSLTLGCDCLGVIHYLDAVMVSEQGLPQIVENAICIHEEDFGILWKHLDMHTGNVEVRRRRRLVVSAIHTVGNYEYGFYWYFHEDGTISHEVKLTGIVQVKAIEHGIPDPHANPIGIGLVAPHHQHLFCFRLDLEIDGTDNIVEEIEVETLPPGPMNPRSNGFTTKATRFESEHEAMRLTNPGQARRWRVSNPSVLNGIGQPVSYELHPSSTPVLHALDSSSIAARARFATKNLWVTPYEPSEHRCAGDYPTQHPGGAGLPSWTASNRSLGGGKGGDVVLWHTFGVTHLVRPEDWPVMPTESTGFSLVPFGFFDQNPALDVSPQPSHCRE